MRPARTLTSSLLLLGLIFAVILAEPTGANVPLNQGGSEGLGYKQTGGQSVYRYQPLTAPNPVIQQMIDQVNEDTLTEYIGGLSGEWPVDIGGEPYTILTRNSFSGIPIQKASEYLFEYYQSEGLSVAYQDFSLGETPLRNVIAEKTGSLVLDETSLISAHYDDAPSGPVAPGADDNASGTAALMVAAQILSQYDFGCTIRFASFSGEEQGLVGSKISAGESYCDQERLRAVINLDMIGWNSPGSPAVIELHANEDVPGSYDLALLYQDVVDTYDLNLTPEIVSSGISASDHASYWAYDFPAILAIEDLSDFNPNYHKTTDRLNALDLSYLAEITKASLAAMAHLSCLVDSGWGTISGTITDESNGMPIPGARISFYYQEWGLTVHTISNDQGRYNLEVAASGYFVSADALGFSNEQIGLVSVAPGSLNNLDVVLQPAPESANFLSLVQNTTSDQSCP